MNEAAPKRIGRPPTGTARSSTERNAALRERKRRAAETTGGRILHRVLLTGEAAAALDLLRAGGQRGVDEAVSAALVRAGKAAAKRRAG